MSLILLTAADEPFTARDIAGRALPLATLDFFEAGTSQPADVGDDDGHFEADAAGVFPVIELEPDVSYRVVHKTADGVLVYDVDPYVCTCGEQTPQFRSPIQRAFDAGDRIAPGALLYSFAADGTTPQALYSDAAFATPLPNPLRANAAGVFPSPIHASDDAEYVLELRDRAGNLLEEFDPYVCACGPTPLVEFIEYQNGTNFVSSMTHSVTLTFADATGENRGLFLQAMTSNGNTLANRTSATYTVRDEDGDTIASGNLTTEQIVFIEVTANCARLLLPLGDAEGDDAELTVEITFTFSTTGLRRLQVQAGLFRDANQADCASPFDSDSSYDDFDPSTGITVDVTPAEVGDLVFTTAELGVGSAISVESPSGFTQGATLSVSSSFRFSMAHEIADDTAERAIDWTDSSAFGGHRLYAGVIRPAGV